MYLVLNCVNWLVGTFVVVKEMSGKMGILSYIGFSILLVVAWCAEVVVYLFYRKMSRREFAHVEIVVEEKAISSSSS